MSIHALTGPAPAGLRFDPLRDSATMLRRNLRRMLRYPSMTVMLVGMPVVFLLLFVYVFGGTLGAGIGGSAHSGAAAGRAEYANYVAPAIILMTVMATVQGTAISIAMDMTEGIIARFRTMHIARVSELTGHVLGRMIQAMFGLAIVIGVALLVGFRPTAGPGAAGHGWFPGGGDLRARLVVRRARPGEQERRDREQPAHAAYPAALPQQRVRPHRLHAGRAALVRREPAVHADDRDPAQPAVGQADREQRVDRARLVCRHRPWRIPLVEATVQPRVFPLKRITTTCAS